MGTIHFVGGEKGGVGKSTISRLLAQYAIDRHLPLIGFDTDQSHHTFSRFYNDFTSPVMIDDFTSMDSIVDAAEQNPNAIIVVDLAAQTARHLFRWIDEADMFALLDSLGFGVYLWHVVDGGVDSSRLLDGLLYGLEERFEGDQTKAAKPQVVVVKNYGRCDSFEPFQASDIYRRAIKAGVEMMELPELHPILARKVDFNSSSFWAAANNINVMSLTERHRVKIWLRDTYANFDRIFSAKQAHSAEVLKLPNTRNSVGS